MRKLLALVMFLLVGTTANAQWYGDIAAVEEKRMSRGYFYMDTLESKKWVPTEPWVQLMSSSQTYHKWWFEMAACQKIPTSVEVFEKHRFFKMNSEIFGNRGPYQVGYVGYYLSDSAAIYVAAPHVWDKNTVQHEMVHALMTTIGEPLGHPKHRFKVCGFDYESEV